MLPSGLLGNLAGVSSLLAVEVVCPDCLAQGRIPPLITLAEMPKHVMEEHPESRNASKISKVMQGKENA